MISRTVIRSLFKLFFSVLLLGSVRATAQAPVLEWQRPIGTTAFDYGYCINPTSDSGFIISGTVDAGDGDAEGYHGGGDILLAKLNASGVITWSKAFGGTGYEEGFCVIPTSDGGYIAAGETNSADGDFNFNRGIYDVYILKVSSSGTFQWSKTYGGSLFDYANNIIQTKDGGYLVTGSTASDDSDITFNHGQGDVWVLKLDDTGAIEWQKTYGGSNDETGINAVECSSGGYIIGSSTISYDGEVTYNHGVHDFWAIRINDTGNIIWQKTYGGSDDDELSQILQISDKGFIMTGYTGSNDGDVTGFHGGFQDFWVVNTDSNGNILWQKTYGGSRSDMAYSICAAKDSGYIVAGVTESYDSDVTHLIGGGADEWVIKISPHGKLLWQKTFGGDSIEWATSVCPALGKGYTTVGRTQSDDHDVSGKHGGKDGIPDIWAVKLDEIPVGVNNVSAEKADIKVYPTVTKNNITVSLPSGYEHAGMILTNMLGKEYSQPASSGLQRTISLKNIPAGNYILSIKNKNTIQSYTVIKI